MWFFLIKSIVGAILGEATNTWFRKTKMGIWFYNKVAQCYNWAAKRYDLDVLKKEEVLIKKFPILTLGGKSNVFNNRINYRICIRMVCQ